MSTDPISRDLRRVRPPNDVPETAFDHLRSIDTDAWRVAVRRHRLEPLEGLPVSEYEHRHLEWLAGYDTPTVAAFAALLRRARAAGPVEQLTAEEIALLDAEADRRLGRGES